MKSLNVSYIDRLDHLRFFAAVLLVYHHFIGNVRWTGTWSANDIARLWLENGSSGVSFFLVLSGFLFCLISNSGEKKISYAGYIYNRILRIFPLLVFLVFIVICCSRQQSTPMDIFRLITLQLNTGNSYTGWGSDYYNSGPIWTIAVEFQFYLLFPFLALFLNKYGPKYLFGVIIMMIATKFNIATLRGGDIYYNLYHTIIGRLDQFCIGMLIGHGYRKGIFAKLSKWKLNLPVLLLSFSALSIIFSFQKTTVSYSSLSFTIEAICWGSVTVCYLCARLPNHKVINRSLSNLGMISFSMYLLHLPVGYMLNNILSIGNEVTVTESLLHSTLRLAIIIAVSFFTFYVIEKPFMNLRVKYTK